jgi:Ankyrin repeat
MFRDIWDAILLAAVCRRQTEQVGALVAHDSVDLNYAEPLQQCTALHYATEMGFAEICDLLLLPRQRGGGGGTAANVNATDDHGLTPLYRSCEYGLVDVVASLLWACDVDVLGSACGHRQHIALIAAARAQSARAVKMLAARHDMIDCHEQRLIDASESMGPAGVIASKLSHLRPFHDTYWRSASLMMLCYHAVVEQRTVPLPTVDLRRRHIELLDSIPLDMEAALLWF